MGGGLREITGKVVNAEQMEIARAVTLILFRLS